jgi:ATPase subunit of ABC transporter with duplicated ATPase domains
LTWTTFKYPAIIFDQEREAGDQILEVENLSAHSADGELLFENLSFKVNKGDKVALLAENKLALEALYKILDGTSKPTSGTFSYGQTITHAFLPNDNAKYFDTDDNLIDWLRQFSEVKDEVYVRGFLGKMLFSGEETFKSARVLSGGEKVRCMLSRMMLAQGNLLMFNEPTSHLDLESIQALNNAMTDFKGTVLFSSHDHTIIQSVSNRILEIMPKSQHDKLMEYDEFIEFKRALEKKNK